MTRHCDGAPRAWHHPPLKYCCIDELQIERFYGWVALPKYSSGESTMQHFPVCSFDKKNNLLHSSRGWYLKTISCLVISLFFSDPLSLWNILLFLAYLLLVIIARMAIYSRAKAGVLTIASHTSAIAREKILSREETIVFRVITVQRSCLVIFMLRATSAIANFVRHFYYVWLCFGLSIWLYTAVTWHCINFVRNGRLRLRQTIPIYYWNHGHQGGQRSCLKYCYKIILKWKGSICWCRNQLHLHTEQGWSMKLRTCIHLNPSLTPSTHVRSCKQRET